jgi:hypothetical protein
MLPQYNERNFDDQDLACTKCAWKGKGSDANVIDFYGVVANKEVHCPECDEKLALVQKDKGGTPGESANDLSFQLG